MINLAEKYENQIAALFTKESVVQGNTNKDYTFSGVRSITVMTPMTQPLRPYTRSGAQRYGTPQEIQDTVQEMEMTQDDGFSMTVDKGNLNDQMMLKKAGEMLAAEKREQVVPHIDKYTLGVWAAKAGTIAVGAAPSRTTMVDRISAAAVAMDNRLVPTEGRVIYIKASNYPHLYRAEEFLNLEKLGTPALSKGHVGQVLNMRVIVAPDSYIPSNCHFLVTYPKSVIQVMKIADAKFHNDPPGISGVLLEGRYYYDAFVLGSKSDGVYADVLTGAKAATPTIALSGGNATITGTGPFLYTLDGSDPRYSKNAFPYTASVPTPSGTTIKAVSKEAGKYVSDVATQVA